MTLKKVRLYVPCFSQDEPPYVIIHVEQCLQKCVHDICV